MSSEDTISINIKNLIKATFSIYAELECLIGKTVGSKNSPENSSTTKVNGHIPLGFLIITIASFKSIESKQDVYRGKDCMKKSVVFVKKTLKINT